MSDHFSQAIRTQVREVVLETLGLHEPAHTLISERLRDALLRLAQVKAITGLSGATIYRLANSGQFPRPLKLNVGQTAASAWLLSEIEDWIAEKRQDRDACQQGKFGTQTK